MSEESFRAESGEQEFEESTLDDGQLDNKGKEASSSTLAKNSKKLDEEEQENARPRSKFYYRKGAQHHMEVYACIGCASLLSKEDRELHKLRGCGQGKSIADITVNDLPKKHNGVFCAECLAMLPTLRMLARHFETNHGLVAPVKEIHLKDEDEFDVFRQWMQKQGGIRIVSTKSRASRDKSRTYSYFSCCLIARNCMKRDGMTKTIVSCTAYARVIPQDDKTLFVEYCTVHSHDHIDDPCAAYVEPGADGPYLTGHRPCSPPREEPPVGAPINEKDVDLSSNYNCSQSVKDGRKKREMLMSREEGVPKKKIPKTEPADYDENGNGADDVPEYESTKSNANDVSSSTKATSPRKVGRPRANTSAPKVTDVAPLEQIRKGLETIFSKLSALPEEVIAQFLPIVNDLSEDADEVFSKFEELRKFRPKRSLCRIRNP